MAAEQKPFASAELEQAALRYLDRFDATAKKLALHLTKFCASRGQGSDTQPLILALIARYRESGLLDDRRYARVRADSLRERGASRRLIAAKLRAQGVEPEVIGEVLGADKSEGGRGAELEAALAYVRRKRLGRFRAGVAQQSHRQKDLARLARQGFDFDTAVKALGLGQDDEF